MAIFILDKNILDKLVLDKMILDEMLFSLGTVPVESLDCQLSENIDIYVCQMFIIKSILHLNKIYVDAFFSIFWCEAFF